MKHTIMKGPLPRAIKPDETGMTPGAGVTINAERGINQFRQTQLTFEDLAITLTDDAGVGQSGSKLLGTFPAAAVIVQSIQVDGDSLLLAPFIDAAVVEVGIGSVAVAGGGALAATEKDVLDIPGAASTVKALDFKGGANPGLYFDGRADAVDLYINVRVADNALHATTANNLLNGTVTILWMPLTEPS